MCDNPDQRGAELFGPAFGQVIVARSCLNNAANAFVKRHGVRQPKATARLDPPQRFYASMFQAFPTQLLFADETWLASYYEGWAEPTIIASKWKTSKALSILRSVLTDPICPKLIKAFPKRELSKIGTLDDVLTLERARLIQTYYNLATQEKFAREFVAFQKALSTVWSVDEPYEMYPGVFLSMASGVRPDDIAAWMDRIRAFVEWWYERDGKTWDAFVNKMMHDTKIAVMRACGQVGEELAGFVEECHTTEGIVGSRRGGEGCFKYRNYGTTRSGHNDTTSGNSLINGLIAAQTLHELGLRGYIIVAGDDMLAGITSPPNKPISAIADDIAASERAFGINPEYRAFKNFTDVTFVSGCWVEASPFATVFVPLLGRLLAKLWWSVALVPPRGREQFRASVNQGVYAVCGSLPVYGSFCRGSRALAAGDHYVWRSFSEVLVDKEYALGMLAQRYRVTPGDLAEFSEYLANLPSAPCLVKHPVADQILARDLADLHSRPT